MGSDLCGWRKALLREMGRDVPKKTTGHACAYAVCVCEDRFCFKQI